jgi:hypothetical protein
MASVALGVTTWNKVTGRRYPAARLVLAAAAAIDLINKMQQTGAAMAQAGLVKPVQKEAAAADKK